MDKAQQRIAEVIPLKKLPREMDFFDYAIPPDLQGQISPGQFVKIPFKNKIISGLVRALKDSSTFEKIKPLGGLNENLANFSDWRLKLLEWFAGYYHYSLASTLRLFIPEPPKKQRLVYQDELFENNVFVKKTAQTAELAKRILNQDSSKKYLLFPYQRLTELPLYLELCRMSAAQNEQILILFPQKYKLREFYLAMNSDLKKNAVMLSAESSFSKNRYFEIWRAIKENKIKIILGTRSAVFSPFFNLRLIIISDAHSEDYKQYDQNPRYEAVNVALKIRELTGCSLILSSVAPRLEDAYLAKKEKFLLLTLGGHNTLPVKIIDLVEERKKGFTYLSDELLARLKQKVSRREKSLLIVNRRGEFTYYFCSDCGYEAVCPECGLPFSVVGDKLICYHCQKEKAIFLACPKCKGANFKKIGAGLNKIKTDLEKELGLAVEVIETKKPLTDTLIYISSGRNLNLNVFDSINLLAFVHADGLVHLADFNSNFKLYSFLQELIWRVCGLNPKVDVIVQTSFSENSAFACLNKTYGDFYSAEIKNRQEYGYPPFSTILKCIFQHHDLAVAEREASTLFDKLKMKVKKTDVRITAPYLHRLKRVRGRFRVQIAVFISGTAKQFEKEICAEIPDYWIIDKNPIDLL